MSVAFPLYLMCKVLFYMRIVYDASGRNVCMYVYPGVCTPPVGSRQASQNKLICLHCCVIVVKWRQNNLKPVGTSSVISVTLHTVSLHTASAWSRHSSCRFMFLKLCGDVG